MGTDYLLAMVSRRATKKTYHALERAKEGKHRQRGKNNVRSRREPNMDVVHCKE